MLHWIAFFLLVAALCLALRRRFEFVLPVVVLAQMLGLTLLAMAGRLMWADGLAWAVLACALALLAYGLLSKKRTLATLGKDALAYVLTPGLLCFGLLALFFWYATEPMVVWWRDDINHWGLQVKSLLAYGGLVDASQNLNLFFGTYTPGVQVLQWWVIHGVRAFTEQLLYFSLYLLNIVFLLPFLGKLSWRRAWLLPVALVTLVAFPTWGNVATYAFLGVDTALGLCFGYVLIQLWRYTKGDALVLVSIALGLCGLVLMKQIGMLLAVIALLMAPVLQKGFYKRSLGAWFCVLAPLVLFGVWAVYCQVQGLSGFHTNNFSEKMTQWLQGTYAPPDGGDGVLAALWHALTTQHTEGILWNTTAPLFVPKLLWLVGMTLAPLALARLFPGRRLARLTVFFGVVLLVFLAVQYVSFFTVFYDETNLYTHQYQDNMSLLMERYLAPLTLGLPMLLLWMAMEAFPGLKAKAPALAYAALGLTAVLLGLTTNWAMMYESLNPNQYSQTDRVMGAEAVTLMDHSWGEDLEDFDGAYVLVGLEPNSDFLKNLRYTFAPTRFALPDGAFTESPEALAEFLRAQGITHVICFDDANMLTAPAAQLAEDEDYFDTYTLYQVMVEDGELWLEEFY